MGDSLRHDGVFLPGRICAGGEGFTQAKNAAHTMAMNFMVFLIGCIGYYLVGFAFQFGGSGGAACLGAGTAVLNSSGIHSRLWRHHRHKGLSAFRRHL